MASPDKSTTAAFSARDMDMFIACVKCLKTEFAVDYEKLAEVAGYKNANSARVGFFTLRKKLEKLIGEPLPGAGDSPAKKRKASAAVAAAADAEGGNDDDKEAARAERPPKAAKKTAAGRKRNVAAKHRSEDVDDSAPKTKVKKEQAEDA